MLAGDGKSIVSSQQLLAAVLTPIGVAACCALAAWLCGASGAVATMASLLGAVLAAIAALSVVARRIFSSAEWAQELAAVADEMHKHR